MTEIPQWAKERVCALAAAAVDLTLPAGRNETWRANEVDDWACLRAFARYIAEHEQPPVDPVKAAADAVVDAEFPNASIDNEWALKRVAYLSVKRGTSVMRPLTPLRSGHGAVVSPLPGAGAKKVGHLIHARRAPASTVNAGYTRQGERPLHARSSLSPVLYLIGEALAVFGLFAGFLAMWVVL